MIDEPQSRARHFEPPLDDARIERQWARIEAAGVPDGPLGGSARRALSGWHMALTALAAAGAMFVALRAAPATAPAGPERASVDAGEVMQAEAEPVVMGLSDGSEVQLLPRTRLSLESERDDAIELALSRGVARFDVTKRPGRRFTVHAGEVSVRVVGTRFELRRDDGGVELRVSEGVVEVRVAGEPDARRVVAGERFGWERPQLPEPANIDVEVDEPTAMPTTTTTSTVTEPEPPRSARPRKPARPPSAAELFEQAHLARRSGRMADAAAAYDALVREHPTDRRAGLSAFEVGRIRMDALGDARGAIAAFRAALDSRAAGAYREDAMARIALAHDALGELAACRDARERYLSRYPAGVHRAALSARCGDVGQ